MAVAVSFISGEAKAAMSSSASISASPMRGSRVSSSSPVMSSAAASPRGVGRQKLAGRTKA